MKTLREVADELCPYRLEDYDKTIYNMIDEACHNEWIDGFITGAQWRENLAIGGYEKDGRHYYTWDEAMEAARSVGKRLPTQYEWVALCDLGSTWDDELKGRWFGGNHDSDHKGSLFLPIAGLSSSKGLGYRTKMIGTSTSGYYWSSSPGYGSSNYAVNLYFRSGFVYPLNYFNRANGFSVRCVRDKE